MNTIAEIVLTLNEYANGFQGAWNQEDGLYNEGEDTSLHALFSYFSHYVADRLDLSDSIRKTDLFDFIEKIMTTGNKDQRDAVATCFLENLLHLSGVKFKPENYFPYLGKKSIEFCRAWDDFNDVKTEGLW